MKLDEWLISQGEDPELMYSGDYELVKGAWNAALEEAAKVAEAEADKCDVPLITRRWIAREVRFLKEE